MPLNEPNQTISDVHGLPVDPALLPLRSERTIVYREGYLINPNGRPIWWNGAAWVDAGGAVV